VAELLQQQGLELIDRNWKTKVCEIDLIMQGGDIMFFVEVKYRRQAAQGDGFEYIGPQKQSRMNFAATVSGGQCQDIQLVEL